MSLLCLKQYYIFIIDDSGIWVEILFSFARTICLQGKIVQNKAERRWWVELLHCPRNEWNKNMTTRSTRNTMSINHFFDEKIDKAISETWNRNGYPSHSISLSLSLSLSLSVSNWYPFLRRMSLSPITHCWRTPLKAFPLETRTPGNQVPSKAILNPARSLAEKIRKLLVCCYFIRWQNIFKDFKCAPALHTAAQKTLTGS